MKITRISADPDGASHFEEIVGKRVTRIDPQSGEQRVAVTIWQAHQSAGQEGVLGIDPIDVLAGLPGSNDHNYVGNE